MISFSPRGRHQGVLIDLDQLCEVSMRGIFRTSTFSSMGYRLADKATLKDLRVEDEVAIRVELNETPPNLLDECKANFKTWVMLNGLRELVESFGLLLQALYGACCAVENRRDLKRARKLVTEFEKGGELKRLRRLAGDFQIRPVLDAELQSMIDARNCITHRWGICVDAPVTIKWLMPECSVEGPNGERQILELPLKQPLGPITSGRGYLEWKPAAKTFAVGEIIRITPAELHGMCLTVHHAATSLREQVAARLRKLPGIVIKNENPPTMDIVTTYRHPAE